MTEQTDVMKFQWTEECSAKVKKYRMSDHATRKTLNAKEFVDLLNAQV